MNVTLNYHRRHTSTCEGKHPARLYTNEYDERKKGWPKCHCPIYASGSLNRVAKRYPTKLAEWRDAEALMVPFIAANSWDLSTPPPPPDGNVPLVRRQEPDPDDDRVPEAQPGKRCLIEDAIQRYVTEYSDAAWNTQKLVKYATNDLQARSVKLGLRYIHEWTPLLVRDLRASWSVSQATSRKKLGNLKTFFDFCVEGEWIAANPAKIKAKRGVRRSTSASIGKQRLPFSDEELQRMHDACEHYGTKGVATRPVRFSGLVIPFFKWTGEDLADFITLSVHTGMRISDVATFHIDRLRDTNEIHIRTIKSQGETKVCTWVVEDVAEMIRARARKFGPYIFGAHDTDKIDSITDPWRERLNALWDQIALTHPWSAEPVHHRFRHTFARTLLQKGVPVAQVAMLMGNTEAIVRKYYRAWVPELQAETTAILRKALASTPRRKVQSITA